MRKTLIFKNISREQKRETWEQMKVILLKEIRKKIQNVDHNFVVEKN